MKLSFLWSLFRSLFVSPWRRLFVRAKLFYYEVFHFFEFATTGKRYVTNTQNKEIKREKIDVDALLKERGYEDRVVKSFKIFGYRLTFKTLSKGGKTQ